MAKRIRLATAAVLALGFVTLAGAHASRAADAPATAPAPKPSLAISDKAPMGCCCISTNEPQNRRGCSYGLAEEACTNAGKAVATWTATWTAGKCPTP